MPAQPTGLTAPADGALPDAALAELGTRPFGLYVHVPFCAHHCGYCDFAVTAGRDHLIELYLDAVAVELAALGEPRPVETLFVGGGTPTHLSADQLRRLLESVNRWLPLPSGAEFTVEANPGGAIRSITFREEGSLEGKGEDLGADVQKSLLPKLKGLYEAEKKRIDAAKAKGTEIPPPKLTLEFAPRILQVYVIQIFDAAVQAGFEDIAPVPIEKKDR